MRGNFFQRKKFPRTPSKKHSTKKKFVSEQADGIFYIVGATIGRPRQSQTTFLTGRVLEVPDR